jgi:hypothetical protein
MMGRSTAGRIRSFIEGVRQTMALPLQPVKALETNTFIFDNGTFVVLEEPEVRAAAHRDATATVAVDAAALQPGLRAPASDSRRR